MHALLKRYRDIDEDARKLVGGGIDWNSVRQQEKEQESSLKSLGRGQMLQDDSPAAYAAYVLARQDLGHVDSLVQKISSVDAKWLREFLECEGLENIYTMLHFIESDKVEMEMAVKEARFASLVPTLMNNQATCEYIVREKSGVMKDIINLVISSPNTLLLVQMLFFFAGLSIYSRAAQKLVQEAANNHRAVEDKKFALQPFHLLVRLIRTETDTDLLASAVSLVNGIVAGEKNLGDRMHIRAMFKPNLEKIFFKQRIAFPKAVSLMRQLDAFDDIEKRDGRELSELRFIGNINLNDKRAIFSELLSQVGALGVKDSLLRHLQQLMLIPHVADDPHKLWGYIERASRFVVSARTRQIITQRNPHMITYELLREDRLREVLAGKATTQEAEAGVGAGGVSGKAGEVGALTFNKPTPRAGRKPGGMINTSLTASGSSASSAGSGPAPPTPTGGPPGPPAIGGPPPPPPANESGLNNMLDNMRSDFFAQQGKKKKVQLLPMRISNNISILRKQFKVTDYELIRNAFDISKSSGAFDTHHYEALLGCVPTEKQMEPLLKFRGAFDELDAPEQFALQLWEVPNVKEKLKSLVFWDNFDVSVATIDDSITCISQACGEVFTSPRLKKMFGIVLSIGNFLNDTTTRSHTRAIDTKTLKKVYEVRATGKSNYNLVNFIAETCQKNPGISDAPYFLEELPRIEEAAKVTLEMVQEELSTLEEGITCMEAQLGNEEDLEGDYFQYFDAINNFADFARQELTRLQERFTDVQGEVLVMVETFGTPTSTLEQILNDILDYGLAMEKATKEIEDKKKEEVAEQTQYWNPWVIIEEDEAEVKEDVVDESPTGLMDKLIASVKDGDFRLE